MVYGQASATPARVLLVEDNEGDAVLTEEALHACEVEIDMDRVRDGVEALAFLRREDRYPAATRPDLIILDLNMPRMSGREVLEVLKRDPDLSTIPVVVLTTSSVAKDIADSYDLQANCYVIKPIEFDQFQTIVQQLSEFWFALAKLPSRAAAS